MGEVAGEFNFLVANLRSLGDVAIEIGLHGVTNGIELQAGRLDSVGFF